METPTEALPALLGLPSAGPRAPRDEPGPDLCGRCVLLKRGSKANCEINKRLRTLCAAEGLSVAVRKCPEYTPEF
jgi:hypothetical protein